MESHPDHPPDGPSPRSLTRFRLRLVNVGCRTLHLVGVSALFGSVLWGVPAERLGPALWLTVGSGVGLLAAEALTGVAWLWEGRGLLALAKLGILLAVPLAGTYAVGLLGLAMVVAAVGSHMPARIRHGVWIPAARAAARDGKSGGERASRSEVGPRCSRETHPRRDRR